MKKLNKQYLNYFIIFSFIGVVFEIIFSSLAGNFIYYDKALYELFNLKIPFISFYGLGTLILLYFHKHVYKKYNLVHEGLINGVLIILWEMVGGIFSLKVFGHSFWDYSAHFMNINGMISLPMSLFWIVAGFAFSLIYHNIRIK